MVQDVSLQSRIHRHLPELVRIIEPDYGLLDELLSKGVLDEMQIADVCGGTNVYEQNNRLLRHFKDKPDGVCQQFLAALRNTKQHHIANFIKCDGGWQKHA